MTEADSKLVESMKSQLSEVWKSEQQPVYVYVDIHNFGDLLSIIERLKEECERKDLALMKCVEQRDRFLRADLGRAGYPDDAPENALRYVNKELASILEGKTEG